METLDKIPPHDIFAEIAVLGAIFFEPESISIAIDELIAGIMTFYKESNRMIYGAMLELFDANIPIDLVTVADLLNKKGQIEAVGGNSFLTSIVQSIPTAANIKYHSKIVTAKYLQRQLIIKSIEINSQAYEFDGNSVEDLLMDAEKSIMSITTKGDNNRLKLAKSVIKDAFEIIEKKASGEAYGLKTGYQDLDRILQFLKGDLIVLAGRPSTGKTALALNIGQNAAKSGELVAMFSLEMSCEQLGIRLLCSEGEVSSGNIFRGFVRKGDWHALTSAAGKIAEEELYFDDTPSATPLYIKSKLRRLSLSTGKKIGLVIVDYLQLMAPDTNIYRKNREVSREQEVSSLSRALKALAKDLDIPVLALSQLNRKIEYRADGRPTLADLRESGAIEQDADIIMFLYKKDDAGNQDGSEITSVLVEKQRNGPTGEVQLLFKKDVTRFFNLTNFYDSL